MEFEKALSNVLTSFKDHILKLKRTVKDKKELDYRMNIYVSSLNVTIYSLLQEELKLDEKIQKKNHR